MNRMKTQTTYFFFLLLLVATFAWFGSKVDKAFDDVERRAATQPGFAGCLSADDELLRP